MNIRLILIFILMWAAVDITYTVQHEQAHMNIFKMYGCDAEIHLRGPFLGGWTTTTGTCNVTDEMRRLHSYNEIVGYHTQVLIATAFSLLILFFVMKEFTQQRP